MYYYDQVYTLYTCDQRNNHIHKFGTVVNKLNKKKQVWNNNSKKETALWYWLYS